MPCETIEKITTIEISANSPNNRHKDALKCYKTGFIMTRSYHLLLLLLVSLLMLKREGDATGR
jgi:hypothetical protein